MTVASRVARRYAIVEAPSVLGLKPTGVDRLPDALLRNGLLERVHARHAGRVDPFPYSGERDPVTRTLHASDIARWSPRLADAVAGLLEAGEFPLVLGGDCSILLGSALALKRRGRFGLLFIDGHADFYQPEVNPNGEAASMELAFATGRGPALLCDLEGRAPLVRAGDVVAVGFRDADEQASFGSQLLPDDLLAFDLSAIRRLGVATVVAQAIEHLTRRALDGFFIHLDADSLHDDLMPAVDYRLPDGLHREEAMALLQAALREDGAAGMEVTIYNPLLDADGSAGRALTDLLVDALGTASRA